MHVYVVNRKYLEEFWVELRLKTADRRSQSVQTVPTSVSSKTAVVGCRMFGWQQSICPRDRGQRFQRDFLGSVHFPKSWNQFHNLTLDKRSHRRRGTVTHQETSENLRGPPGFTENLRKPTTIPLTLKVTFRRSMMPTLMSSSMDNSSPGNTRKHTVTEGRKHTHTRTLTPVNKMFIGRWDASNHYAEIFFASSSHIVNTAEVCVCIGLPAHHRC